MKLAQSVIVLTLKDTGKSYLFGSLAAIYGMFDNNYLGISYSALRNAVAMRLNPPDEKQITPKFMENEIFLQVIFENKHFTLQRAPLLLQEREKKSE